MSSTRFERDTAVTQIKPGLWRGEVNEGWMIGNAPNGGYMMAIAARAMSGDLPHKDPLSFSLMYLSPAAPGPVDIEVDTLRAGRGMTHARARMLQGEDCVLQINAIFGDLGHQKGANWSDKTRPEVPPFEDCELFPDRGLEFRKRMRMVLPVGTAPQREPGPDATLHAWLEFDDHDQVDLLGLLLMTDAIIPPIMRLTGLVPWVPTLDLYAQLRARPAPGPIQMRQHSHYMTNGIVECDGECWDSEGHLVALVRQTQKIRVPEGWAPTQPD